MKYLIAILFVAFCLQCQAQFPDYYVYMVTGDVTIIKPGAKPIAVEQKQLVYKNDVIAVKKGGEITLLDKDANYFLLNTAGNYTNVAIKSRSKTHSEGITRKYLRFLFDELINPDHDFEKFKKENIAGVWGGVERSEEECENRIFPINGLKTSAASIVFRWHKSSPSSNYSFVIYDAAVKELFSTNVKDSLYAVNVNETLHGIQGKYFWRVTSDDGNCEKEVPIYFDILTPENEKKQVEQFVTANGNENLEIKLQQIDKLEKNAYINGAAENYAALVKAYPDNKALLKSYVSFLLKYGFDKEAKAVWK